MRTKNAKSITTAEREHMGRVKELSCVVCETPGPSHAHHIEQGKHFLTVPLCEGCHVGRNGIHGEKRMWLVKRLTELGALNLTIQRLMEAR